jgi:hypothetical protein
MPDYGHRKIELTPRQQADGRWRCHYRIIEFRPTSWGYHHGCADGDFASRQQAEVEALAVAKRIIDSLEPPVQLPPSDSRSFGRLYGDRMSKLVFHFLHGVENLGKLRR